MYNINNKCEKVILTVSYASLLKRLTKTMETYRTPRRVTKVTVTEKKDLQAYNSARKSNISIKQLFDVLSVVVTCVLSFRLEYLCL